MGDSGLAGDEAGNSKVFIAETETGFGAFAVEFGEIDADVGVRRGAVGEGLGLAAEGGEVGVVRVVAVQNNDVGI